MTLTLRTTPSGDVCLTVRVQPGRRLTQLVGIRDGDLVMQVSAAAVEGRANAAVIRYLAGLLSLRPSQVHIVRGERHRSKSVVVSGLTVEQVRTALEAQA